MGEKNLWSKAGLIAVLTGLCFWQMWPVDEKLKPGIDLGGGHSLIFEIDDTGRENQPDLAEKVMTVLRNRVDPQGTMNLVWRPIGRNRLMIQMPNPPSGQKEAREAYNAAREPLADTYLQEAVVRSLLDASDAERDVQIKAMTRYEVPVIEEGSVKRDENGNIVRETIEMELRRKRFEELLRLHDEYESMVASTTQPTGDVAVKMDGLLKDRRTAMNKLLESNLNENRVLDILKLGASHTERASELDTLKQNNLDYAKLIERLAVVYDEYAKMKGVLDDPADLMRMIRGAGVLEFRILAEPYSQDPSLLRSDDPSLREPIANYREQLTKRGPRKVGNEPFAWFVIAEGEEEKFVGHITEEYLDRTYVLAHDTEGMALLDDTPKSWALKSARIGTDRRGRPSVNFTLDTRGGTKFGRMTGNNLERALCIFLDRTAISSARIQGQILSNGEITGDFGMERVRYLVNTLEAGSLPARLKEVPLEQKSVGPSLGSSNRAKGEFAIITAFVATIIFMMIYYGYNGFIADIALLMNLVITLGVMAFIQATFTLAGIAGLVLTLGMAVDANVLIFERIREELQRGVSVRMAIKLGYEKAFSAILDSNVTTIITAVILGSLGSEDIKGFGLTLGIGLVTSMFTALFVTRQFFHVMIPPRLDLTETRKAWFGSIVLALAGGLIFGLGYAVSKPALREDSGLVGLGEFLLTVGITAIALLAFMWIFRIAYHGLGHAKNNKLPMLRLFSQPNIDWMGKYRIFWTISAIIIVTGFIFESTVDHEEYLDIEFLGGTSAQITLKDTPDVQEQYPDPEQADQMIQAKIGGDEGNTASAWLLSASDALSGVEVNAVGDLGDVRATLPEELTQPQVSALLTPVMDEVFEANTVEVEDTTVTFRLKPGDEDNPMPNADKVKALFDEAAAYAEAAAGRIGNPRVQRVVVETDDGSRGASFDVISTETSAPLVAEAILASSLGDDLQVTPKVDYTVVTDPQRAPDGLFPVKQTHNTLSDVIGGNSSEAVGEHKGGFALVFEELQPALSLDAVETRITEVHQLPDFAEVRYRPPTVIGLELEEGSSTHYTKLAVVAHDPVVRYNDDDEDSIADWRPIAQTQMDIVKAAFETESAFRSLTAFMPQIADEASQKAVIAILLSLIAIAGYLWIRFGSVEYGLAGIIALYHDVAITLSLVMACHHLHSTFIGDLLLIQDFRIDLAMIAAFLTIVGYSINDSIVIFDRIRENRGRMATVSSRLINTSLNQTLSRTLITSLTTFLVVMVMYIFGGDGIHGFAFAMIVGVLSGTYSTIAIATPMLQHPRVMWSTAIVLASVTLIAMVNAIDLAPVKYALIGIILVLAALAVVKQVALAKNGGGQQPATA